MDDLCELQRPLLGKQVSGKPFSHVLPGGTSAKEGPTSPHGPTPTCNQLVPGSSPASTDSQLVPQLLDTCSLQNTVESLYCPSLMLHADLRVWASSKHCTETTFTENGPGEQKIGNSKEPKVLESEAGQAKVPTVSVDVEDLPYLETQTSKATAKGDYRQASSASRKALCTAICSIALGVCTYIGGMVALVIYLAKNGHS
ncbi:synapse differentiation-inducing gene protein 1-like [Hemiscyllium ocellatum]|uniref:synapse differentiation-inducing gene protein 1-like n=1 Tax=Hemiscyllium ocellatum TaxID=170820 RepID=UPI00296688ED|nr:synapse differentiation-inducing gene protein 1-like [Hemiscyllium ocellatum]